MSRSPSFSGTAGTREGKEGEKALVMSKIPRLRLLEAGLRTQECSLDNINQSVAMLLLPSLMSSQSRVGAAGVVSTAESL